MEAVIKIRSGVTKWDIRQMVWDYIEENNLANFPRPVHNRIPNFKGALTACARVSDLEAFAEAAEVKVDPDKPLEGARLAVLQAKKTLLVPTPRLRAGLFNKITPPDGANKEQLRVCSTSQGVKEFSVPVSLDAEVKVDLVVVGSVAVSEKGYRIGKGEGFADMEYGMMVSMGAVNESTVVVTVVHDCQVVDIPEELLEQHDLSVDYILTPTRMIKTECLRPKPPGIIWAKLNRDVLQRIPILKKLRSLELQAGKEVLLGPEPAAEPAEARGEDHALQADHKPRRHARARPRRADSQQDAEGDSKQDAGPGSTGETEQRPRGRLARGRKEVGKGDNKEEGSGEKVKAEGRGRSWKGTGGERGKERKAKAFEEGAGEPQHNLPSDVTTVYLGGIPAGLRVSELKTALRERDAAPLRLTWQGAQHRAFLDYGGPQAADRAIEALRGLCLNEQSLHAELAKNQRGGVRPGPSRSRPRSRPAPNAEASPAENSGEAHEETAVRED